MINAEWILLKGELESEGGMMLAFFYSCHRKSQFTVTGYFLNLRNMVTKSFIFCEMNKSAKYKTEEETINL